MLFSARRHPLDFTQHDEGIFLPAKNHADRLSDVGRRQSSAGNLVKQWLEQVVVIAIDDGKLDGSVLQRPGAEESPEATTDDDDPCFCVPPEPRWRGRLPVECSRPAIIADPLRQRVPEITRQRVESC